MSSMNSGDEHKEGISTHATFQKITQFTHRLPHQCQSCTNAGGDFSRDNK